MEKLIPIYSEVGFGWEVSLIAVGEDGVVTMSMAREKAAFLCHAEGEFMVISLSYRTSDSYGVEHYEYVQDEGEFTRLTGGAVPCGYDEGKHEFKVTYFDFFTKIITKLR